MNFGLIRKFSRFFVALLIVAAIGKLGQICIENQGSKQKLFADHDSLSFSEVQKLPESKWEDIGHFAALLESVPPIYWIHTRIKGGDTHETWAVTNNFGWFRQVDFYYQRDSKVTAVRQGEGTNTIFPRVVIDLAPNEELDVYIKIDPIEIMIVEILAAPLAEIQRWEHIVLVIDVSIMTLLFFGMVVCIIAYISIKEEVLVRMTVFFALLQLLFYMLNGVFSGMLNHPIAPHPILVKFFWVEVLLTIFSGWWAYTAFINIHFSSVKWKIAPYLLLSCSITGIFTPYMVTVGIALVSIVLVTILGLIMIQENSHDVEDLRFLSYSILFEHLSILYVVGIILGFFESSPLALHIILLANLFAALGLFSVLSFKLQASLRDKEELMRIVAGTAPSIGARSLQKNPYGKMIEKVNHNVSIMFIDIVDFSIASKQLGEQKTFERLSEWSSQVRAIIRKHGGEIDRSLGDGLLAFFGFHSRNPREHATLAFKAATEIQEVAVKTLSMDGQAGFPTRIGIHTDKVIIGNLGGESTDHTLIGDAVNFASRLEGACNSFRITISEKTFKLLDRESFADEGMNEILINIKHHHGFIKAYQYNFFYTDSQKQLLKKAEINHFEAMHKIVRHDRLEVDELSIHLRSSEGYLKVYDFSMEGFGVESETMFGPRSKLQVSIESSSDSLNRFLDEHLLRQVNIEIRWSRKTKSFFHHGVLLLLSDMQKEVLFKKLEQVVNEKKAVPKETAS